MSIILFTFMSDRFFVYVYNEGLDLVQGPSLVHYDSLRAFPSLPLRL